MRLRAKESFGEWLAESADTAEGRVVELLAQLSESIVPEFPLTTYAHLWHSNYNGIRSQIWHLYNDNHDARELGEFAQGDLYIYAYRRDGKITIWFQSEWEPEDELAGDMVEDIEWDDYEVPLEKINDTEELADALADLLTNVWCTEAEKVTDPERIQWLADKDQPGIDWFLTKNQMASPELLLTLEARYKDRPENRNILHQARENPNYPEDKTDWALGDW